MSDSLAKPDELRAEVRKALESRSFDSLKIASAYIGGAAAISGLIGGGLAVLQKFTLGWFATLGIATAVSGILVFVVLEFFRLRERSTLLKRLLDSERYVDDVLRVAWTERDRAQERERLLQTRLDVVMTVREISKSVVGAIGAPEQKALPEQGDENV